MFARLNLASQPFRNRTLPWAVSVVIACASLVALVFIVGAARNAEARADRLAEEVRKHRAEKTAMDERAAQLRQSVSPEDLRTLEAAQALVDRKRFSWSQLLADLEEALPSDVRVTRINVREVAQVGGQMRADLDLSVVGRKPDDVTGMIARMQGDGVFLAQPVTESPLHGRGEGGFEWVLRINYVQRAVGAARGGDRVARAETRGEGGGQTSRREAR